MEASAGMLDVPVTQPPKSGLESKIKNRPGKLFGIVFGALIAGGLIYAGTQLISDLESAPATSVFAFVLLGIALFVALGFEFVNGFHDTANAVATVIYTRSMPAELAVIWLEIVRTPSKPWSRARSRYEATCSSRNVLAKH